MPGAGASLPVLFAGLRSCSLGRVVAEGMVSQLAESEQTGVFLYISSEGTG